MRVLVFPRRFKLDFSFDDTECGSLMPAIKPQSPKTVGLGAKKVGRCRRPRLHTGRAPVEIVCKYANVKQRKAENKQMYSNSLGE